MGRDVSVNRPLLAALVGLTLAACAPWQGPKPLQAWKAAGTADDVVALDKAAHTLVAVQTRSVQRTPDGRMAVRLELANLSDQDLTVQVQTLFRDAKGVPTGEDTPFEAVVLPGMGSTLYETASLGTDAQSFTVQVKTP